MIHECNSNMIQFSRRLTPWGWRDRPTTKTAVTIRLSGLGRGGLGILLALSFCCATLKTRGCFRGTCFHPAYDGARRTYPGDKQD
jgi:hypothetical protein